ncbi:sulfur oxidation c-type cytochrome SoxX [Hyphomicrobium sp. CS1BSMeth3]|uniref:sulfur oxidation c-type cytochrome SoxX n=1 Tax=Hyphomicrobium sp. CS1BSMeth3 TaxID=1892844 RepID=UPI000930CD7C|nr:sulfur oxidation c-type cytochrome SoxX [Hyphomicrobium sp. CS1BSMeth3]
MKKHFILAALAAVLAAPVSAQETKIDPLHADVVMKFAFSQAPKDWAGRVDQDETLKVCSAARNAPSAADAEKIMAREKAKIKYPDDGKLMGDWKQGERWAQSGYGMRFTDYPPRNPNGGNCYACHQMTQAEVSYGTVGPSLREYGKIRKYAEADVKAVYEKIYNAHAAFPCSLMPRFGSNAVLTIDQIKDLVALVMSPESPVNK